MTLRQRALAATLLAATVWGIPAFGQAPPESPTTGEVSADVGFGKIGEDYFLTLGLGFAMQFPVPRVDCPPLKCSTTLGFGVLAPLRLRMIDNDPQQEELIRQEDWDETSDFLRVIRFVEYGKPNEPLHARIGELGGVTVGHGTIVNAYYNVVTPDAYQLGLHTNLNTAYGGAQVMIDNLISPSIVGVRAYARPWAFIDRNAWLNRLAIGLSTVVDGDAPLELRRDANDVIVVDPNVAPDVADAQATVFNGIDVELNLVDLEQIQVTPYTDFNVHWGQSAGWHLGTLVGFQPIEGLGFASRLELRLMGEHYLPDYVGPLYEIDRYQYDGWGTTIPAPKLRVAASQTRGTVWGGYGDLQASFFGLVVVTGAYSDAQGPDNATLRLRAQLAQVGPVSLAAMYYKQNFDGLAEAFELDGALGVAEARVFVFGPVYVRGQYSRLWRLADDGTYENIDDWNVGGGAAFTF
ncbi:MAG: hypothetical protein R3E66_01480 [bacterium]